MKSARNTRNPQIHEMPDLFDNFFGKLSTTFNGGHSTPHYGGSSQVNTGRFYSYHMNGTNNNYWLPAEKKPATEVMDDVGTKGRMDSISSMQWRTERDSCLEAAQESSYPRSSASAVETGRVRVKVCVHVPAAGTVVERRAGLGVVALGRRVVVAVRHGSRPVDASRRRHEWSRRGAVVGAAFASCSGVGGGVGGLASPSRRVGVAVAVQVCLFVERSVPALAAVQVHPVEVAVSDLVDGDERLVHQGKQVLIVRVFLELEVAHVGEVSGESDREPVAELIDGGGSLLHADFLVLSLVGGRLQALPGQRATQKVHKHMAKALQVVSSQSLAAQVRVDGHVAGGAAERLLLPVRNVSLALWVPVSLGHAEVNNVDHVGARRVRLPDEEIVWLDVPVNEVVFVDGSHSSDHSLGHSSHGFRGELAATPVEQVLQRGAQKINHKDVVHALSPEKVRLGHAHHVVEYSVQPVLVSQSWRLAFAGLELDGDLSVVEEVDALENDAEGALADLLAGLVVHADTVAGVESGHCRVCVLVAFVGGLRLVSGWLSVRHKSTLGVLVLAVDDVAAVGGCQCQ